MGLLIELRFGFTQKSVWGWGLRGLPPQTYSNFEQFVPKRVGTVLKGLRERTRQ